jgi:hypothetical protein
MPPATNKVTCPTCGHHFPITGNRTPTGTIDRKCAWCHKHFEAHRTNHHYCTRKCQVAHYRTTR